MTTIDIVDLRKSLREYLERARLGERILVTDGGEPLAELVSHDITRRLVAEAVANGEMQWNGGKPKGLRGIVVRGETMSETVIRARR